jgi:hypothetical protein
MSYKTGKASLRGTSKKKPAICLGYEWGSAKWLILLFSLMRLLVVHVEFLVIAVMVFWWYFSLMAWSLQLSKFVLLSRLDANFCYSIRFVCVCWMHNRQISNLIGLMQPTCWFGNSLLCLIFLAFSLSSFFYSYSFRSNQYNNLLVLSLINATLCIGRSVSPGCPHF